MLSRTRSTNNPQPELLLPPHGRPVGSWTKKSCKETALISWSICSPQGNNRLSAVKWLCFPKPQELLSQFRTQLRLRPLQKRTPQANVLLQSELFFAPCSREAPILRRRSRFLGPAVRPTSKLPKLSKDLYVLSLKIVAFLTHRKD